MKKNNTLWLLLLALCSIFAACKKDRPPKTELEKLPPATQTGANTFGCLLNGQAWVAHTDCKYLCDPAFKIHYDAGNGGNLGIESNYANSSLNINQTILIGIDSTNYKSDFFYNQMNSLHIGFSFVDQNLYTRSWDSMVETKGNMILTKYDLQNGIISGTFEFSLTKPGNQIISVTNGRFDYKLF